MQDGQSPLEGSRSNQQIPKLRTRGRANRKRLLAAAQKLIEKAGGQPIRFSDVFKAAGVSRGSAYRIYDGIEDLLQDLASSWINNFVESVRKSKPTIQPDSWMDLSDHLVAHAAAYWFDTRDTLRVLPRVRSNLPESYRAAVRDLTQSFADAFDQYLVMPDIPDWLSVLAMYTSLGDTIFSDAARREGHISEQRLVEAQKICTTYLSFYLPTWLLAKVDHTR